MSPLSRAALYTQALVRCPSVTPEEGGALSLIEGWLKPYGFSIARPRFESEGSYPVENLYARLGTGEPCLVFAGHTDVVPPGDQSHWAQPPFSGAVIDGEIWGRGAQDMKAGVAASIAAVLDHLDAHGTPKAGSIAFLITGDEEADAINGTVKLLEWAQARGERFTACLLGEPTNPDSMGEMMKIGRRGSLSGELVVHGTQGHVGYPERAVNPIDAMMRFLGALKAPLDQGTAHFSPSNLEVTSVDVGNPSRNVIPGEAKAKFNIRFNDRWTAQTLGAELQARLAALRDAPPYTLILLPSNAPAFLTEPGEFVESVARAIQAETGVVPKLSTTGGTSDARFIAAYCPVIEFGTVGTRMHQVNERVAIADIDTLSAIYRRVIEGFLIV
jgi:succinyl-diaminopimelate desuccinylase